MEYEIVPMYSATAPILGLGEKVKGTIFLSHEERANEQSEH